MSIFLKKILYSSPMPSPTRTPWDASVAAPTKSQTLLNPMKLGIPPAQQRMFLAVNDAVRIYMNGSAFDPSHDYEHIQRVIALAHLIYTTELSRATTSSSSWTKKVDPMLVYLGAMMHDIGEPKYLAIGHTQAGDIQDMLTACNVPLPLARQVEYLIPRVSFSRERADPEIVQTECNDYPALRIIQDADRLDSLGAVGQGRCFVFGGANEQRRELSMHTAMQMHPSRFALIVKWMKTETGKKEAEKRWKKMERYLMEWNQETDVSAVIDS